MYDDDDEVLQRIVLDCVSHGEASIWDVGVARCVSAHFRQLLIPHMENRYTAIMPNNILTANNTCVVCNVSKS